VRLRITSAQFQQEATYHEAPPSEQLTADTTTLGSRFSRWFRRR
jgi:hypothetical protein